MPRSSIQLPSSSNRSPEIQIRRSVRQASASIGWYHPPEQEHVAVAGVKRRGILGDVHERIMRHGRPIQHARHFHMVSRCRCPRCRSRRRQARDPDASIIRTGDGAKCEATVIVSNVFSNSARCESKPCCRLIRPTAREAAADRMMARRQAAQLPKTPMCGCTGSSRPAPTKPTARHCRGSLHPYGAAFHGATCAHSAAANRIIKIVRLR